MVREAFKLINGEGWYIVPTGQGPSPIFTALKSIFHIHFSGWDTFVHPVGQCPTYHCFLVLKAYLIKWNMDQMSLNS